MAFNQRLLSYQKFLRDLLFICQSAETKKRGWKNEDNPPHARQHPRARPAATTTTTTVVEEGRVGVKTKQNQNQNCPS
jgi:hypothetical protein